MASLLSIHSCSLGAPILLEEAKAGGERAAPKGELPTPARDKMKAIGQWNTAWNPFFELDPVWTDEFMATGGAIYASGTFTPKEVELLSIAFDASHTHMYAPGTRRHIIGALKAGATVDWQIGMTALRRGRSGANKRELPLRADSGPTDVAREGPLPA